MLLFLSDILFQSWCLGIRSENILHLICCTFYLSRDVSFLRMKLPSFWPIKTDSLFKITGSNGNLFSSFENISNCESRTVFPKRPVCVWSMISFFSVRPEKVEIIQKPTSVLVGREYQLVCQATGSKPPPVFTWYKNRKQVDQSRYVVSVIENKIVNL